MERGLNTVDVFIVIIFVKYLVGFMSKVLIVPSNRYEQDLEQVYEQELEQV